MAFIALPFALPAQALSGGVGWWTTTGGRQGEAAAHGVRVHGALGMTVAKLETDLEAAFSQAIFSRSFAAGSSRVNENSLEFVPLVHLRRGTASWWPYAGPLVSVGTGCGTAGTNDPNGSVACNTGSRSEAGIRLGVAGGLAFARSVGAFALTAEARRQTPAPPHAAAVPARPSSRADTQNRAGGRSWTGPPEGPGSAAEPCYATCRGTVTATPVPARQSCCPA